MGLLRGLAGCGCDVVQEKGPKFMVKHRSRIKPESWLVAAGRFSDPGAPLNVPIIPASNFILGAARSYSRNEATQSWEALEEIVGGPPPSLLRLSVGIEDVDDLWSDLDSAITSASS